MIEKKVVPNPGGGSESVASTCPTCKQKYRYRRELVEKRFLDDAVQERIVRECACSEG